MKKPLLVRGARQLVTLRGGHHPRRGAEMNDLGIINHGALLIQNGQISHIGTAARVENLAEARKAEELNAEGRVVLPGFVDSHTHIVFGPPRLLDYEMRLAGASYEEIAAAGGGILSSVRAIRGGTARALKHSACQHIGQAAEQGVTTLEIKSGYGLSEAAEIKMLRIARSLDAHPLDVVTSFLGAHAVPPEYAGRSEAYLDLLVQEVMPVLARQRLARFADIYCDRNAFSVGAARTYLAAARALGLGLKIHASQFENCGAVQLACELGAVSADHLEAIGEREIDALAASPTIATLLPGSVFHLGLDRYAPARRLIEAGAAVALATDFNPGTSPTCSMPMVLSIACAQMRMKPAEAITAATFNGACALGVQDRAGSLEYGKQADLVLFDATDYREIPYYFGVNLVHTVVKRGEIIWRRREVPCPAS
jgi:imidazolonepropionase